MGLRPTRTAFRRPPGSTERRSRPGVTRTGAPPSLSLSFRGPSPHPRTVPPGEPAGRTMPPLLGFRALRHMTGRRTRVLGEQGFHPPPACRVRGFFTPCAASTADPPGARRRRSVHGLLPSRPSPRTDGYPSRGPCPRVVARVESPRSPWGADGRGRLQGLVPGASSCGSALSGARRCLPGVSPSRAFPPSVPASALVAGPPPPRGAA